MKFLKLTKKIKTTVKSYAKDSKGEVQKDEKGNPVVADSREILIDGIEIPQFESVAEAIQQAGSEEKFLAAVNKWTKDEAVAPVRIVGNKFSTEDDDDKIKAEGRALAKNVNPFADRRGSGANAVNKQLADQYKKLQEMASKGISAEDILAALMAEGAGV